LASLPYLPDLATEEVEIARITIALTTQGVTCAFGEAKTTRIRRSNVEVVPQHRHGADDGAFAPLGFRAAICGGSNSAD
jgi:hypothetical protein